METKKSLIKIEKRHEVRKMERFMNNKRSELDKKVNDSYGKHWTVQDYHYSMVIYQFLMSEFSELSNKPSIQIDRLRKIQRIRFINIRFQGYRYMYVQYGNR